MAIKGILLPIPRLGISPAASSKLWCWAPGTTTKQTIYSDSDLTTPISQPLQADGAGLFSAVYIDPALSYKMAVYASSEVNDPPTGTPLYSQDNAYLVAQSYFFPQVCQFRLTLESAVPISSADQSAKTTLYATPYTGNRIDLYNSTKTAWERLSSAEFSITLAGLTASTLYDVFAYNNAGTPTLELTAWSSSGAGTSTRATAIALQDGARVKSGTTTRLYLGTVFINSSGGQTDDTLAKRYLWNHFNRVARPLSRVETTSSWTYTTATVRQANGSTANQVEIVTGIAEAALDLSLTAMWANSTGGVNVTVGIGEDSTTTYAAGVLHNASAAAIVPATTRLSKVPAVGYHKYCWNEWSSAIGTTSWYSNVGAVGSTIGSGLNGSVQG